MSFPICNSVQIDSDPPPLSVTRPTLIRVTIQFNARYVYHIAIEIWIIYELIEYICTFQSKYGLYTIRVFSLEGVKCSWPMAQLHDPFRADLCDTLEHYWAQHMRE